MKPLSLFGFSALRFCDASGGWDALQWKDWDCILIVIFLLQLFEFLLTAVSSPRFSKVHIFGQVFVCCWYLIRQYFEYGLLIVITKENCCSAAVQANNRWFLRCVLYISKFGSKKKRTLQYDRLSICLELSVDIFLVLADSAENRWWTGLLYCGLHADDWRTGACSFYAIRISSLLLHQLVCSRRSVQYNFSMKWSLYLFKLLPGPNLVVWSKSIRRRWRRCHL